MKRLLLMAVLVLLSPLMGAASARAADPAQVWRTITTPHFYVHYYRNERHDEQQVAQRVARSAEKAHAELVPLLGHAPDRRTHIVVTDDTDGANGSAQIVPMNIVRVYVTGPSSISGLNDFDDHIYALLVHEYTHILHIDTIHGLPRLLNAIFGKTWAPNQLQPKWFIEGLAVYQETERTAGGRNRNAIYDMYLRTAVLQGKLLDMDEISSYPRLYPRGTVHYLYGSRFIKYIADRFGPDKLTEVSHLYGGTVIPYAINRTLKKVLGYTFLQLYEDFKGYLKRRYDLQRAAIEQRGAVTPFRKITDYGEACGSPRFSSDGRQLVFIDTDGRSQFAIKVLDVAQDQVVERHEVFGASGVGFTPDGQYLVYGQSAYWKTIYRFHDIFVRHRKTGEVRRLTKGLRARDPAVSPDGARVAFTMNELGSMSLAIIPFDGGRHRVLYKGGEGDQIFNPRWSPDGRYLTYSRWRKGGNRDIYVMEVASGQQRRITDDRALDMDPQFSGDGRRIYFASDRTGVYNIFCHDLETGRLWQVSNLLTGAFTPAISPDEKSAYYVGFSYIGHDLHAMALDRSKYLPALPYVNDRPAPAMVPEEPQYPERPYSPLRSIYPRAWSLQLSSDGVRTWTGFELQGGDVVGRHAYYVAFSLPSDTWHPAYGVSYSYNRFWPSLRLDTSRSEGQRGGVVIDGARRTYTEENYGAGLSVGLPVLRLLNHYGDITVGYRFNWFRDADQTTTIVEPGQLSPSLPRVGILSGASVTLSYANIERYAHSISTEKGRALSVSLRINHPSLGSDYESIMFSYHWTEFVDLPWLDDHVLALRLGGGIGAGDTSRRGVFSVGGFPEQDVLRTLFDIARPGGVFLRGYTPGALYGDQYHLFNLEYRMPLFDIEWGIYSLPIYFNNVHLAAFVDVGNAFFGTLDFEEFKVGVGAEILLEMVIGYALPTTFRIGYARGLMEPGGDEFHFLIGRPF